MTTAADVAAVFESIAPQNLGIPGDQLGFLYGDPTVTLTGVACLWNIHAGSLARCVDAGLNMLICHEGIWMPEQTSAWYDAPPPERIHANVVRRALLDEHDLVVYRSHSNWDALPVDGVPAQAIAALGIDSLRPVAERKFFSVVEMPEPMAIGDLFTRVQRGLGYGACRVFGDVTRSVRRFAFLIGGFGENQHHMPQVAKELGAEVIILGEMSEFIVIGCLEMGLPVIETLHSVSEIPAIRRQAELLAEHLPGVRVEYVDSGAAGF